MGRGNMGFGEGGFYGELSVCVLDGVGSGMER